MAAKGGFIVTLIVCVDEQGGMTYNGRRQSRDGAVLEDIKRSCDGRIFISPFSEKYFKDSECTVAENPLSEAGESDYCFIEDMSARAYLGKIDKIIIYNWNEEYPLDTKFDILPLEEGFRLTGRIEFAGRAHKKITKEIYRR